MATQLELAQMSAAAYRQTGGFNRIEPPAGWVQIWAYPEQQQTSGGAVTGFSASAFRNASGEIVIAYTGTNSWKDWPGGNLPAAGGVVLATQVAATTQ